MSVRLARLLSVALIGACLATPAFAKSKPKAQHASAAVKSSLVWRGDVATANGVVNEVAKAWEKSGHGRIELQPFNTASGIDAVAGGTADLAGSARASDNSAQNANLTFTPVAWDALVIVTQSSNPVRSLSLKQVHDIYYGRIHNWSEVGGSNAPIDVYAVASPGDGVEYSLRELLFGRGNQPVAAPRLYVNTRKLEEGIALNPNGLGVSTLASISGNPKLKAIPIDGKPATAANIADGSYPLFIPLYLVTNPRSPKAAQAQAFIDFMQTAPAEAALRKHAVLPYQDGAALVALDTSRRSRILVEAGARPVRGTPVSAPGATYAARAAIAPTSPDTLAARQAVERRRAEEKDNARLSRIQGSVSDVTVTSVDHASGSATSLDRSAGKDFGKVDANASHALTTYKVAKGDTLSTIAKRHSVEVAQLRLWNHLKNDQLKLGQVLRLRDR
ncbi:peptidoglycan-binding protein [Rhodanobacter thiooxydans]|uniref:Peptidoglycan-binding protein n=1 Tax=Rhodanobacter thiooxydans TaxID=416169 RepID=A0A154QI14_9GAMM|nr:substrate-binding domain-containing protein [Rhodanobacter thiooxydans]EIL98317.1 phosphate ABC transporter periplasmic protein [Rhodanobacter thiooxydans LCS2]KZC23823.1 peptidoglycan-binding protein [Rhodanobacter thiooxydans]MCW0202638.1 substrate-binding domain-containing protein [Rhodanobacter thiooxydans]